MARRTHGEGSIHKREDGRWSVLLGSGSDALGNRLRRSTTCRTQKEAKETLKRWLLEREQGLDTSKQARVMTVEQLMAEFLQFCQDKGLRPKTIQNYEQLSRLHIVPVLGTIEVQALDTWTITRLLTTRKKLQDKGTRLGTEKIAPRTSHQMRMVLRLALEMARKRRIIAINPADDAEAPPLDHYQAKSLTLEGALLLLNSLKNHPYGTFYTVMLGLGMRPGEVRGLKWEDFSSTPTGAIGERLCIQRQVQRVNGAFKEVPVKTKKGRRWVIVPGFVLDSLTKHRMLQRQDIVTFAQHEIDRPVEWADLVFQNSEGMPLEERYVVRKFHDLTEQLGLPQMRLYDLRRTCVTLLHAMGVPANVIKDIVGHSQISVTMDYYTDTHDTSRVDAARVLDAALGARATLGTRAELQNNPPVILTSSSEEDTQTPA